MDKYTLQELAYNNGYDKAKAITELDTRLKVSYEQLAKCHTKLCRQNADKDLCEDFREVLNKILNIQVKLGTMKREEDIR